MKISTYLLAGFPVLYYRTSEQERAMSEILDDIRKNNMLNSALTVMQWKSYLGLYPIHSDNPDADRKAMGLDEALRYISGIGCEERQDHLYILFNVKEFLKSPLLVQQFRDTARRIRTFGSHIIIIIGGAWEVPEELEELVTFVDLDLPNREELKGVFRDMIDKNREHLKEEITEGALDIAADNALGMTAFKAENAISLSIVSSRRIDINLIRQEKQAAVKQTGVLEYVEHNETPETLGGFTALKEHAAKRRKYFLDPRAAQNFGLRPPKGVMLVGVGGTGKTLAAKAISATLDLPLYKFDVGAVFKGVVGGSESSMRHALKMAEAVSPACLLADEFEKLVSGLESSGKTDSGVTSRVIGTFLTWMQETKAPIFKIATCNSIRNLDSPLFRKGRFDEVFGVDLPTRDERATIFSIHLKKRGRRPEDFDIQELAGKSEDFVGAEIEACVETALYTAYSEDRELATQDMLSALSAIVPQAVTAEEEISAFRAWCKGRVTSVSGAFRQEKQAGKASKLRNLRV